MFATHFLEHTNRPKMQLFGQLKKVFINYFLSRKIANFVASFSRLVRICLGWLTFETKCWQVSKEIQDRKLKNVICSKLAMKFGDGHSC